MVLIPNLLLIQLVASLGYFITDAIQLGGSIFDIYQTSENNESESNTGILALDGFMKYHIYEKGQTIVPYLGIQAGYFNMSMERSSDSGSDFDSSSDSFSFGGMGGLKIFLSEKVSFNVEYNYRHYQFESGSESEEVGADNHSILLGISYYFGT